MNTTDADLARHDHANPIEAALDYAMAAARRARHEDLDAVTVARLQLAECGIRHAFFTPSLAERDLALTDANAHLEAAVELTDEPAVTHPGRHALQLLAGVQEADQ